VARGLNFANGTPLSVAAMLRQGGSDANRPAVRTE
jgi:hypothetical protein